MRNYGNICKPLIALLRKDQFKWSEEVKYAFQDLKKAKTTPPVLALLDFSKDFVIETNASSIGIRVVLMQECHFLAYISNALSPWHQRLSIYEKKLFSIVYVVTKWHHYLYSKHFSIKIDHQSLEYFL